MPWVHLRVTIESCLSAKALLQTNLLHSNLHLFSLTLGWMTMIAIHQQKLNLLHEIYLVYCTHKLKKMKSRFP
jgi:hypothetical protein